MKLIVSIIMLLLTHTSYSQVIINEIQSSNTSTIYDNYGEYEDWIEIYNPNDFSVDIAGLVLKDNVDTWRIPVGEANTLLAPKSYFLLWADDQEIQGKFHTNFKLSAANGEFLGLYKSDSITLIESVNFPPLSDNQSYGKCDGGWVVFNNPTPLLANNCPTQNNMSIKDIGVYIYPAITQGNVTVNLPAYTNGIVNLYIFSTEGKLVLHKLYNNKIFTIDLGSLNNDIYLLNVTIGQYRYTEKIIVNK